MCMEILATVCSAAGHIIILYQVFVQNRYVFNRLTYFDQYSFFGFVYPFIFGRFYYFWIRIRIQNVDPNPGADGMRIRNTKSNTYRN
jgi:hypothetical protein